MTAHYDDDLQDGDNMPDWGLAAPGGSDVDRTTRVDAWVQDDVSDETGMELFDPEFVSRFERAGWTLPEVKAGARDAFAWLDLAWWGARFQAYRSPGYASLALLRGIQHLPEYVARWWHWATAREDLLHIRWTAREKAADLAAVGKAEEARLRKIRWRCAVMAAELAVAGVIWRVVAVRVPVLPWWSVGLLMALASLAVMGVVVYRRKGLPIRVETAPRPGTETTITTEKLRQAFAENGLTKPDVPDPKTGTRPPQVTIGTLPHDDGMGTWLEIDLPGGVTFAKVKAKQDGLAGPLGAPEECVEVDPLKTKAGSRIGLYVGRVHPLEMPPIASPLMTAQAWNLWDLLPLGTDVRRREVLVNTLFAPTLVAAKPRVGKSTIMRAFGCAQLLDPRGDLAVFDFGGGTDYSAFEDHAEVFVSDDDDAAVKAFRDWLLWANAEFSRRRKIMKTIPKEQAPESRITEAIAMRDDFRLKRALVDEFQVATLHPVHGDEILTLWDNLNRRGSKDGVQADGASQELSNEVAPAAWRRGFGQRLALSVADHHASTAILGEAAGRQGLHAEELGDEPGWAIVVRPGTQTTSHMGRLRVHNITAMDAYAVTAGLVYRDALPPSADPVVTVSTDASWRDLVLGAWPDRQPPNAQAEELADVLGVDAFTVRHRMRTELGLKTKGVKIGGSTLQGYARGDVERVQL